MSLHPDKKPWSGKDGVRERNNWRRSTYDNQVIEEGLNDWLDHSGDRPRSVPDAVRIKARRAKRARLKRWCGGKEGQEHDYRVSRAWPGFNFVVHKCFRCDKEKWGR
jgi:hypothetical protein